MTGIRSHIFPSSSSGDTAALPTPVPPPPENFPAGMDVQSRTVAVNTTENDSNRQEKLGIFRIASPVRESVNRKSEDLETEFCGFLEKCYYCFKKFRKDEDIFMYSNFKAFCSRECRHEQIDIDQDLAMRSLNPRTEQRVNIKQCGF